MLIEAHAHKSLPFVPRYGSRPDVMIVTLYAADRVLTVLAHRVSFPALLRVRLTTLPMLDVSRAYSIHFACAVCARIRYANRAYCAYRDSRNLTIAYPHHYQC